MSEKTINWPDFYMEFADKLLKYKDKRTELIQKIKQVFADIDKELPTLERDENGLNIEPYDIDPFTIYALFNKQIKDENRIIILSGIKKEFSIESDLPKEFTGIPTVNNRKLLNHQKRPYRKIIG